MSDGYLWIDAPPAHELVIERIAEEALAEGRLMVARAREATDRGFAFLNRSNGQRFRWAKYHNGGK